MLKNLKNSKSKEKQKKETPSSLDINIKDIIYQIKNIFNHYSKNKTYLSNNQYKIFLIEASLLDNIFTPQYSETLFYSYSNSKDSINFKSFLDLIFKLSEIKFPEKYKENQSQALILFFAIFINPLIDIYKNDNKPKQKKNIYENKNFDLSFNDMNHKLIISKISSMLTKELIEENYLLFLKIYQKYFCFENLKISRTQKNHLSQRAFIKVMNDFNISPEYLNSEQIEDIFDRIIDNRDYTENIMNNLINIDLCNNDGMWFTLFHFIVGLYLISILNVMITNYDENNPKNIWEIFIHNNDSKAFDNIIKLLYKSPNLKKVMPEEIRKMQSMILDFKNKSSNFNEDINNNLSYTESNDFNKLDINKKRSENQNIVNNNNNKDNNDNDNDNDNDKDINKNNENNENNNLNDKSSINYHNNNSKQNTTKSNKTTNIYNHRILSNFIIDRIKKNKSFTLKNKPNRRISSIIDLSSKANGNANDLLSYLDMAPLIIKKYKKHLISVYKYYSELYLETIFSVYMTQNGFINLIKDLNLLANNNIQINENNLSAHQAFLLQKKRTNLLSFTAINLIFSKFSSIPASSQILREKGKTGNKRINFINFIYIILILANKIFNPKFNNISFDDKFFSYDKLANTKFYIKYAYNFVVIYINPLYQNILPIIEEDSFNINNLKKLLETERLNSIANVLIPLFIRILKCYNDNNDYIGYSQYFKFLSDFNLFPDFVPRTKMIKIFINFINNFDDTFLLQGNNKIICEIEDCVYGILYIGIVGNESGNIFNNKKNEINILNFIRRITQCEKLGKISILNLRNTLQKDFLNAYYEIKNYILGDKQKIINESIFK